MIGVPRAALVLRAALSAAVFATAAEAQPVAFLDVPYIQQSEALCGGAASAMVMRYWGASGVYAESFSGLVEPAAGGIRGERLLADLSERGWDARSFSGDQTLVAARLAARQPAVALIEDRPGAFHYVVIVAWTNGRVVYHDPARAPFRVVDEAIFDAAWSKSQRWTMLLLPRASTLANPTPAPTPDVTAASGPCAALVDAGVRMATGGDTPGALDVFASAADLCPSSAAPLREAAGVHAIDRNWSEARRLAGQAVVRDRSDAHAWRILATSAYVAGDTRGALEAWNAIGEPQVDLVTVQGLNSTRHASATALLAVPAQVRLSASLLDAAGKRLAELPAADVVRVTYKPAGNGLAHVEAVVLERPRVPRGRAGLGLLAVRAAIDRELVVDVANPTGAGDLISASWRWWANRARIAVSYAAPSRVGVWRTELFTEKQTYGSVASLDERRRGGSVSLSNWTSRLLRWELTAHLDGWDDGARTGGASIALDQRLLADRVSVQGNTTWLAGSFSAIASGAGITARTRVRNEGFVLLGAAGLDYASSGAPLALSSGAGTGHARRHLLRAHPLLDDGRLTGDIFGRKVYAGSIEVRTWLAPIFKVVRLAPAVFVDTARAEDRRVTGSAWHTDAGIGLRIALPGSKVLRVDVAKGLRDGAAALSFGFSGGR